MSYDRPTGTSGGNTGIPPSVQDIGAKIAGNQGGYQYESKPGGSVSGGAIPERNTYSGNSGSQEPGYEHISAPNLGGANRGPIESSGGPTYNPSSLGQQGGGSGAGYGAGYGQKYGTSETSSLGAGSGATGLRPESGSATIGGAGINKETTGSGFGTGSGTGASAGTGTGASGGIGSGTNTGSTSAPTTGATGGAGYQGAIGNAQRTVEPYVAQAREVAAPYVEKAQEVGSAALESARPLLNQAAGAATQAYNAAATELDARGINKDSTQQKLAEVGQTMKDYGAVGQQRAGEYLAQAVDQAKNIGQDRENKSIVATIFGTVFLIWLAFGFSIGAVFALGVAGSIAAVLSRYSRHGTSQGVGRSNYPTGTSQGIGSSSNYNTGTNQGSGGSNYPTGTNKGNGGSNYPTGTNQGTGGSNYPTGASQGIGGNNYPTGASQGVGGNTYPTGASQGVGGNTYPTGASQGGGGNNYSTGQQSTGRIPGTTSNLATPGVETHFPQPAHPDNSLHTNLGK